jgi:hypothetical protein
MGFLSGSTIHPGKTTKLILRLKCNHTLFQRDVMDCTPFNHHFKISMKKQKYLLGNESHNKTTYLKLVSILMIRTISFWIRISNVRDNSQQKRTFSSHCPLLPPVSRANIPFLMIDWLQRGASRHPPRNKTEPPLILHLERTV